MWRTGVRIVCGCRECRKRAATHTMCCWNHWRSSRSVFVGMAYCSKADGAGAFRLRKKEFCDRKMRILIPAPYRLEQRSGSTWLPPRGRYGGDRAITKRDGAAANKRRRRDVGGTVDRRRGGAAR